MSVVKSELVESLADRAGVTQKTAERVLDVFVSSIADTLCSGGRVEIRGFGAFGVKKYASYMGRNPKTGETIKVPPKKLPIWKTGRDLKQRVDDGI